MATKLSTDGSHETLWQIMIRGKSVLYFKRSGKVKKISYQLVGGFEFYLNRFGAKFLVALATRKEQFRTLTSRSILLFVALCLLQIFAWKCGEKTEARKSSHDLVINCLC